MQHAFLPMNSQYWLCSVSGADVVPLALAPGEHSALRRFSADGSEFAVLDQQGKRVGHYRLLSATPWFENVRPPATLPKGCVAHTILVHRGQLLVGGHGDHGEALWLRQPGRQPDWVTVALPEGLGKRGKAIDALYVREQQLVAIDNILLPKWVLVYPLEPELDAAGVQKFRLGSHTTYETIRRAADGPGMYALHSHGYNHGTNSTHLSVVREHDFREIGCWSGVQEPTTQQLVDDAYWEITMGDDCLLTTVGEPPVLDLVNATLKAWSKRQRHARVNHWKVLADIHDMVFCGNLLVLALGKQGLAVSAPLSDQRGQDDAAGPYTQPFQAVALQTLTDVHHLHRVDGEQPGLYAIGTDTETRLGYEWVGADRLVPTQAM